MYGGAVVKHLGLNRCYLYVVLVEEASGLGLGLHVGSVCHRLGFRFRPDFRLGFGSRLRFGVGCRLLGGRLLHLYSGRDVFGKGTGGIGGSGTQCSTCHTGTYTDCSGVS